MDLNAIMTAALETGASDFHVGAGIPPRARVNGVMRPLSDAPLEAPDVLRLVTEYHARGDISYFTDHDFDGSLRLGLDRVRIAGSALESNPVLVGRFL